MKKNLLFFTANALLVVVIGVIIGLICGDHMFADGAGISAFVCLLLALCLPSPIYIFGSKMTPGGRICSVLFVLLEIALDIVFMIKPSFGIKPYWITQAILIAVLLVAFLIILALFKDNDKVDSK